MTFDTYHWREHSLDDPDLERARNVLASGDQDGMAFLTLLRSGHIAAIGMALDHFHYAETTSRHGSRNPFSPYTAEILDRAREILARPPSPRSETGARRDGADHASALVAMLNLAQPEDSDLIATALQQAPTPDVQEAATMSAGTALDRSTVLNQNLVSVLSSIILDESKETSERVDALKAFNNTHSPHAAEIAERALGTRNYDLEVHAAIILATHHLATHRTVVERIVASWPDNIPYPAAAVIDALYDSDID